MNKPVTQNPNGRLIETKEQVAGWQSERMMRLFRFSQKKLKRETPSHLKTAYISRFDRLPRFVRRLKLFKLTENSQISAHVGDRVPLIFNLNKTSAFVQSCSIQTHLSESVIQWKRVIQMSWVTLRKHMWL